MTNLDEKDSPSAAIRYGLAPHTAEPSDLAGVAYGTLQGQYPLNGLRHPSADGYSGWFVWVGSTLSDDANYFQPQHVSHLLELRPELQQFLDLPPGWRFLIAPGYEDVWFDESLLVV